MLHMTVTIVLTDEDVEIIQDSGNSQLLTSFSMNSWVQSLVDDEIGFFLEGLENDGEDDDSPVEKNA